MEYNGIFWKFIKFPDYIISEMKGLKLNRNFSAYKVEAEVLELIFFHEDCKREVYY